MRADASLCVRLRADAAVLRSELAKTVTAKSMTSAKLEQIRKRLGLSEGEARAFLQELDEARGACKALRDENKELHGDNAHLKQQLESRSQHTMTLIGDNKRLLEQVKASQCAGFRACRPCVAI